MRSMHQTASAKLPGCVCPACTERAFGCALPGRLAPLAERARLRPVRRLAQTNKPGFGPYGGCQGQRFPFRQCQLKNQTDPSLLRTYEAGDLQPYVLGIGSGGAAS